MATPKNSWLILEQASHSVAWGVNNPSEELSWRVITRCSAKGDEVEAPLEEAEIVCVVFLPSPDGRPDGSPSLPPEALTQLFEKRAKGVRVWFHYGGNVAISKAGFYWSKWKYLDKGSREGITHLLPNKCTPQLFSAGQKTLPWNAEFKDLRALVKAAIARCGMASVVPMLEHDWLKLQTCLSRSWIIATDVGDQEALLERLISLSHIAYALDDLRRELFAAKELSSREKGTLIVRSYERNGIVHLFEQLHRPASRALYEPCSNAVSDLSDWVAVMASEQGESEELLERRLVETSLYLGNFFSAWEEQSKPLIPKLPPLCA